MDNTAMKEQAMEQQHIEGQEDTVLQSNQKQEPIRLRIKNFEGKTVTLVPRLELYSVRDFMGTELPGLAVDLDIYAGEFSPPMPYTSLTVNFGEYISVPNSAYIDTNNFPFADQLLAQGIAEQTGLTKSSGFCTYPLWVFKEDFLKKIGGKKYQEYTQAYERYDPFSIFSDDEETDMADDELTQEQAQDGPEPGMTGDAVMSDYEIEYMAEVTRQFQQAGFSVKPEEDGRLSVEQDSQQLCHVNSQGTVFYDPDTRADREQAFRQIHVIVNMTSEYMRQMERAPELKAAGLDSGYKLLGEFNDTVLAGRETSYGVNFITWSWNQDHTGLSDGHYFMENYIGAKQDFAVRSGAIRRAQIFTPEQLTEVYRSIQETLEGECPITDARRELLEEVSYRIDDIVPYLEQRVSQSSQQELELAQELEGGAEYEQGQSFAGL